MTSINRKIVTGAIVLGTALGSYGVANAASGSSSSSGSGSTSTTGAGAPAAAPQGWGAQRSDETLLTGDTAAKVTAIAQAKLPGATVDRVETDADGHAAYEAHVTKSDGTLATVYVDKNLNFVSIESR
jgi:hypothetical protein